MLILCFIRKITDDDENDSDDESKKHRMVRHVLHSGSHYHFLFLIKDFCT